MKSLLYLIGGLLGLGIVVFFIIPVFLPSQTDIEITQVIDAPKTVVHNEFNVLKKQSNFNAFLAKDSMVKKLFLSPYEGINANFTWTSENPEVGKGDVLILKSNDNYIETLVTLKDFNTTYHDQFTIKEKSPTQTQVSWKRVGDPVGYLERYLVYLNNRKYKKEISESLQMLNDKIGKKDYTSPEDSSKPGKFAIEYFNGAKLLLIEEEFDLNDRKIPAARKRNLSIIKKFLTDKLKLSPNQISNPIMLVESIDTLKNKTLIAFGYSVETDIGERPDGFIIKAIPSTDVLSYSIIGNYRSIDSLHSALNRYATKTNQIPSQFFWIEELKSNKTQDTLLLKGYLTVGEE